MIYWDTSALLKLYVTEPGSQELLQFATDSEELFACSAIATIEMLCALHRKQAEGDLGGKSVKVIYLKFLDDIRAGRLSVLPLDSDVTAAAEKVVREAHERRPKILLCSLDAIHLATAISARALIMVTADTRLRDLAEVAGMKVVP